MTKPHDLDELLPCPFCGSSDCELVERQKLGSASRWHRVICLACEIEGPETQGCGLNYHGADRVNEVASEAIAAWNTRASLTRSLGEG
jgi:Lar family restriction alleviation protein